MLATGDVTNALLPMTTGTSKKKKCLKAGGGENHQMCRGQGTERMGFGADELGTL